MEDLNDRLELLSLTPVPPVKSVHVLSNPLDIYRAYLAEILAGITGCDLETTYQSIQWPNNIFNGDLAVILPKIRPGAKANEVAFELMQKVS